MSERKQNKIDKIGMDGNNFRRWSVTMVQSIGEGCDYSWPILFFSPPLASFTYKE